MYAEYNGRNIAKLSQTRSTNDLRSLFLSVKGRIVKIKAR